AYEGDPTAVKLPSPALGGDTLDFSFSGLKTAALNYINTCRQSGAEVPRADLAASYTAAIVKGVTAKTEAALKRTGYSSVVLAGGVAANSHLRASLVSLCGKRGVRLTVPPLSLCGDNGAMVAAAGYYAFAAGQTAGTDLNASAEDHPAWEK
ncbi:MAG: tRNA (adenosine(37)-N6)-threonylcarbamoyltransferase complex transferase subunit TsaD, partial [Clostridia bacterium]|nr:tRNA (adenosine(37)-N6)-threonylcarbamoyltransferase complex transferase subunit TsaD [Clostridia bacterium]